MSSTVEFGTLSSASPTAGVGVSNRAATVARGLSSFADLCTAQVSTATANEPVPSVPVDDLSSLRKAAGKAIATKALSPNDSATGNLLLNAGLASLPPVTLPTLAAPQALPNHSPQESFPESSTLTSAGNNGNGATQVPQATSSGFPSPLPGVATSTGSGLNATSLGGYFSLTSAPLTAAITIPSMSAPAQQLDDPRSTVTAGNQDTREKISDGALLGTPIAQNVPLAPQGIEQTAGPADPAPAVDLSNAASPSQPTCGQPRADAPPTSAISTIAASVSFGPQASAPSDSSASPGSQADAAQPSSPAADKPFSTGTSNTPVCMPETATTQGAPDPLPPALFSPAIPPASQKQASSAQTSRESFPSTTKLNFSAPQISASAIHSGGTSVSASSDRLPQNPPPLLASLPNRQPVNPSISSAVVPLASLSQKGNLPIEKNPNSGKNAFMPENVGNPSPSHSAVQDLIPTGGADTNTNSSTAGDATPDPDAHKVAILVAGQTSAPPASAPQPTAVALASPTVQATNGVPSSGFARTDSTGSETPTPGSAPNLPASGEFPANASAGPVQLAQMTNTAAQSEMRIGLNTSAFGNVEVRTVVHANDVGIVIGSERGDLRSLISTELPAVANTLQQQNLRLNQVTFRQQGFAFSSQTSSGRDSQPQASPSRPIAMASRGEISGVESGEREERPKQPHSRGLSILA